MHVYWSLGQGAYGLREVAMGRAVVVVVVVVVVIVHAVSPLGPRGAAPALVHAHVLGRVQGGRPGRGGRAVGTTRPWGHHSLGAALEEGLQGAVWRACTQELLFVKGCT